MEDGDVILEDGDTRGPAKSMYVLWHAWGASDARLV